MYGQADVTYRPMLRQLVPELALVGVAIVTSALLHDAALVAVSVLALGLVVLMWRRFGTLVRHDGLVVLGMRNRFIPWADVDEVREHRQYGGRGIIVVEPSGRRTLLKAPRDGLLSPDRGYDEKHDHIVRSWEAS